MVIGEERGWRGAPGALEAGEAGLESGVGLRFQGIGLADGLTQSQEKCPGGGSHQIIFINLTTFYTYPLFVFLSVKFLKITYLFYIVDLLFSL